MEATLITNQAELRYAAQLLEEIDRLIESTQAGKGYFLLPLVERGNELELLGKASALRLSELRSEATLLNPEKQGRVLAGARELFSIVADYIQAGDGFPPQEKQVQEALLFLLRNALRSKQ